MCLDRMPSQAVTLHALTPEFCTRAADCMLDLNEFHKAAAASAHSGMPGKKESSEAPHLLREEG